MQKRTMKPARAIVLMECVPAEMGRRVTESLRCPTIGIGAGVDCDGQVLVMHDMRACFPAKPPNS